MKKMWLIAIVIMVLSGCATIPAKPYEEAISGWKSYTDVVKWMSENFVYDQALLAEHIRHHDGTVRSPRVTFKLKSGVCWDGARLVKETLDVINPAYEAQIVYLNNGRDIPHYVCSFKVDGKLYIMDYSTAYSDMVGIFGPFDSLEGYRTFYAGHHESNISASFGWPSWMKDRLDK
jgi:uncharacterized protein YceK